MTKRIIALLLSLMLTVGITLALASCGETPETPTACTEHTDNDGDGICDTEGCGATVEAKPAASGQFNESGELYLFKNGTPTFHFIMGSDAMSQNRGEIEELANLLTSVGDGTKIEFRPQSSEAQDVEILVGTVTTRGDEYKFDKYTLGAKGYMVKQVGTKIIALGGSSAATATAVSYLKETVFGIKKTTDKITDLVMAADANCEKPQTGYKITSVTVDSTPLSEFTITYPSGDKTAQGLATKLQEKLYTDVGIRCEVKVDKNFSGKQLAIRTIENDGEGGGFYANVKDGNLVIECEFEGKFESLFNEFINENLFGKRGKVSFTSDFAYNPDLRTITYEQFKAYGDDEIDDFAAIKAAHEEANEYLLKVRADDNAVYYLTKMSGADSIVIKTDTYWGNAKFIIRDSDLTADDAAAFTNVFKIESDYSRSKEDVRYYPTGSSDISKILKEINENGGIKKDELTTLDFNLGRDALVYIYNNDHKNYVRFGSNKNTGEVQREFIYLNADGTVASDTGLLFDYDNITYIEVFFVDDRPITVDGGIFTTEANGLQCDSTKYIKRGIQISRSNTTVQNLKHYITGEGDTAAPYSGFIIVSDCSDVTVKDSILTAHRTYIDAKGTPIGTYDLAPTDCNRLTMLRVTQSNFFEADGVTPTTIGTGGFWGIMGSNRCKNLTYEECTLSRFDAHQGTLNASIIRSNVGDITLIGGGEFKLVESKVYAKTSSLITLREDYGATWNGDMLIKDTEMVMPASFSGSTVSILAASWNESALNNPGDKSMCDGPHDFGYDCYMPRSVVLDNFTVSASSVKNINLVSGTAYAKHKGDTVNKYYVTERYEIIGSKGYSYGDPRDCYNKLTFIIDGIEQD